MTRLFIDNTTCLKYRTEEAALDALIKLKDEGKRAFMAYNVPDYTLSNEKYYVLADNLNLGHFKYFKTEHDLLIYVGNAIF